MILSEVFPPQHGGSGKWLWEIYRRLPANQFLMAVGDSHGADPRDCEYPQPIERLDLSMPSRQISRWDSLGHYFRQIRAVRRLAKRNKVQAIHAARPLSEGLVARMVKLVTGIPYLCYVHGEDISVATTSRELTMLTRSVLKHSRRVIANSSFTHQMLLDEWGMPPEKVTLMHPGVDTNYFVPNTSSARPDRWIGKTVILTVGRLQQRKGHDTVIRSLAELADKRPDLHYVIVGGGDCRDRLENLASQLQVADRVEFAGEVDDDALLGYFQQCDLFVLANRDVGRDVEGFGIVLIEAQACGKPVVAGKSGGTLDTIEQDRTGYLVNCDTPHELVEVLDTKLDTPTKRHEFGKAGRERVVKQFDWAAVCRQATDVLPP